MPQKKKTSSKKKKVGDASKASQAKTAETQFMGSLPDLWKDVTANNTLNEDCKSAYCRYKEATTRFIQFMRESCPTGVYQDKENDSFRVNDLILIADWMEQNQFPFPKQAKRDLKLTIRTRSRYTNAIYGGGGDEGHRHFLRVLQYCWTVLIRLPEADSTTGTFNRSKKEEDAPKTGRNRYEVLMEEFEEEDTTEEEDTEDFPQTVQLPPEGDAPLTLKELLESEDRNDAFLFLWELNEMMGHVSKQYIALRENFLTNEPDGLRGSTIIKTWLEATVCTNMAIQQVQHLEMDLMAHHPHFTTPYRLLAAWVLPAQTKEAYETLRQCSRRPGEEKDVTVLLGDILECCFSMGPDKFFSRKETILQEFGAQWDIDEKGLEKLKNIFDAIHVLVTAEVPIAGEKASSEDFRREMQTRLCEVGNFSSHCWIKSLPFIGDDRAIHHTLRLLQVFGQIVPNDGTIEPKCSGFFGEMRKTGHVKKTRDLDELVMTTILPQLFALNRHGIWQFDIPMKDELCPLFKLLGSFFENAEKPVTWSLTFAIHAMLTGILEADEVVVKLLDIGRGTFDHYFESIKNSFERIKKEPNAVRSDAWDQNMSAVFFLENLGLPKFGEWALWNPLCGGTIMTYLAYFANLEAGFVLVDIHAQLRIVLHLFHALFSIGLIKKGEIPLLDHLYDGLRSSKGLWEGELPKRGEFTHRFWICHGCSYSEARENTREAQLAAQGAPILPRHTTGKGRRRRTTPLAASGVSKSYRRLCERDFSDVVDKYHTPEQRRSIFGTERYRCAVRTNDTLDAIENEQHLLSFIMPTVGILLEQFVCNLGRVLRWDQFLSDEFRLNDCSESTTGRRAKRDGTIMIFARYLLGTLDFVSDPVSHEFMGVPIVKCSLMFMKQCLGRVDPHSVRWFTPIEYEENA